MAWDEGKKFVFRTDPAKIDADLTDFPVMIRLAAIATLDAQDLTAVFDELGANRKRIAVFAGGDQGTGTECYVEIEKWDETGEEAILHVKIPSVDDADATEMHLYYDNSQPDNTTHVGDTGSAAAQNVWGANFGAVYHLAQDPTGGAGAIKDSTGNANHGTALNMESGDLVDGKCGNALDLDGSNERVDIASAASIQPANQLTIEVLLYHREGGNYEPWVAKRSNSVMEYQLHAKNSNDHAVFHWYTTATKTRESSWALDVNAWNFIAAILDTAAGEVDLIKNGETTGSTGDGASGTVAASTQTLYLGWDTWSDYATCKLCEIRISKGIRRSNAWIKATYYSLFDQLLTVNWTGIVFANRTPPGGSQAADGTQIECDVTDNWYTFENADITITVAGEQYTSADPEVTYEPIADGKRIVWIPPPGHHYGRGATVAVRVDAKNSHNDESYTEWSFVGKYHASAMEAETSFFFHSPAEAIAELLAIFRQASEQAVHLGYLFRHASGGREDAVAQLVFGIRDRWIGTGECEPTVFICELKRTFGQGGANVAEVEVLAGEASANIYGQYLLIAGGDANIQAFQIFAVPAGSGDIQVTLVWEGQGSANLGIPARIGGEGSAQIFKVEGTTFIRINALPAAIRQALQDAGIIINA